MKSLLQDVRYSLRMLRKSPGFTAVAIITLALGIGANTAIFSLINAIMLRTLPVKDPQSLVLLKWVARRSPDFEGGYSDSSCPYEMPLTGECSFSFPMFQKIQAEQNVFSGMYAFEPVGLTVNSNGRPSHVQGLLVSGDFFSTLGAHPALGRLLGPADDSSAAAPAVVVSYRFWRTELGGDPNVTGKSILAGKAPVTIVGVASPGFLDLDPGVPTDFWLPLSSPAAAQRFADKTAKYLWLGLMARLKPNVGVAQAASAMSTLFTSSVTTGPEAIFKPVDAPQIKLPSAAHGLATLRQDFSRPLFALLAAVVTVLLTACANLAGLMLARSAARRKEIAMRTALGATRGRIIRQLLTESLLLSAAGGTAGILLGWLGAEALAAFLSRNWYMPMQVDVHPDPRVLAFTVLVSMLVGVTVGLTPALSSGQKDLVGVLKEGLAGSASATRGRRITLGNVLVVVQIALTLLVLVGAGLFVRTLTNLKAVNPGFDTQNLLLFGVDETYSNRAGGNLRVLHRELQEQLAMLPGVTSISYSAARLLAGGGIPAGPIFPEDQPNSPIQVELLPIAPDFFKTMQIPLLAGRTLNAQDSEDKQADDVPRYQPLVINKKLAHRLFGDRDPIGRHFRAGTSLSEVVGVVDDAKYDNMRDSAMPTIYAAIGDDDATFEIRTAMDPKTLMPTIRAAVSRFDRNLLITDMKTQEEQIDQSLYQERLIANLSRLFALLALVVASVGIYGLLSYQVTRRTHEIGIRLALGAQRSDVMRLVIRQGAILAELGVVIGIAAALAVTRYLQSFLYGVKPSDPVTIIAVAFLLIAVALLASYIPARRAMKPDPMVALRYE